MIRFYHNPKSGGTAIYNMTKEWKNFKRAHPRKNHVKISQYPPNKNEIAMTVIRHPYSRFESAFYHMVDSCNDRFYYRYASQSDCNTLNKLGIDFNIFRGNPNLFLHALYYKSDINHKPAQKIFDTFSIFKPQFYWLSDIWRLRVHPKLKIILRQENLRQSFDKLAMELGQIPMWPGPSESNRRITPNIIPLTEESKQIIREVYKNDFKYFKFE